MSIPLLTQPTSFEAIIGTSGYNISSWSIVVVVVIVTAVIIA
jgi:hypothetical protein